MSRAAAVDQSRVNEFRRDWNAGMLNREMAVKYGCSGSCVTVTAQRLGLARRKCGRKRKRLEDDADVALSGGAWTPNERGVMVWRPDAAA